MSVLDTQKIIILTGRIIKSLDIQSMLVKNFVSVKTFNLYFHKVELLEVVSRGGVQMSAA